MYFYLPTACSFLIQLNMIDNLKTLSYSGVQIYIIGIDKDIRVVEVKDDVYLIFMLFFKLTY